MNKAFDKILGRLEKESDSANDKIMEQETEKDMAYYDGYDDGCTKAVEIVKLVASEYNNGWIPCSERLPEVDGLYICSCKGEEESIVLEFATIDKSWIDELYDVYEDVTAWMPLPEPYHPKGV